ncbi:hypothetical protein UUU_06360 [Klebsiella pneumoniae subsp. pneumoniae DSM 30104 = JCM 1662 = NBRC 14940]|nr:hypothetical protein UUU_06360 [Klebsiella pneumoniae subsp. pneumoniae DSM 30104 = JCM 1662 = NBRC 14940]
MEPVEPRTVNCFMRRPEEWKQNKKQNAASKPLRSNYRG